MHMSEKDLDPERTKNFKNATIGRQPKLYLIGQMIGIYSVKSTSRWWTREALGVLARTWSPDPSPAASGDAERHSSWKTLGGL